MEAFRFIVDVALDWYQFHFIEINKSDFSWYDMACGLRASRIALILSNFEALQVCTTEIERRKIDLIAHTHISHLSDKSEISLGNHAIFQLSGLYYLASVFLGSAFFHRRFCKTQLDKLIENWFTPEGIHKEHSPEYHKFTIDRLRMLPENALSINSKEVIKNANEIVDAFTDLDGKFLEIGDTNASYRRPNIKKLVGPDNAGIILDYIRSGYWLHRHPEYTFIIYSAAFNKSHKHADDLAFIWSDHKGALFVDGGKYSYDRNEMRNFIISPRAHNTVSVVGRLLKPGDIRWPVGGTGFTAVRQAGDRHVIEGRVERPGYFVQARRLEYTPGQLIRIEDELLNQCGAPLESLLNIDGAAEITALGPNRFKLVRGETVAELTAEGGEVALFKGSTDPLYGWRSRRYREIEPCHTLALRDAGSAASRLTWTIRLGVEDADVSSSASIKPD